MEICLQMSVIPWGNCFQRDTNNTLHIKNSFELVFMSSLYCKTAAERIKVNSESLWNLCENNANLTDSRKTALYGSDRHARQHIQDGAKNAVLQQKYIPFFFFFTTYWTEKFDFPSPVTVANMPDLQDGFLPLVSSTLSLLLFFSLPLRCIMLPYSFEDGPGDWTSDLQMTLSTKIFQWSYDYLINTALFFFLIAKSFFGISLALKSSIPSLEFMNLFPNGFTPPYPFTVISAFHLFSIFYFKTVNEAKQIISFSTLLPKFLQLYLVLMQLLC